MPVYTGTITAVGAAIILIALRSIPANWAGLLMFVTMAALADVLSVEMFVTSRGARITVSSAVSVASILVFGPWAGALTIMVSGTVSALATSLRGSKSYPGQASLLRRASFNTGMFVIAAAAAGWSYVVLGGTPGKPDLITNALPLIAATTIDWAINVALLIGVLVLQTSRTPQEIWKQDFQWQAPINVLGDVLGGAILALAYQWVGVLGSITVLVPILATGYSYRLYVGNMRQYVDKLEAMNQDLEAANLGLLEALGAVIDAYDIYTYGHSRQVAIYAAAIAEKMRLPADDQAQIVRAALIHDVGKVGITDSIIGKQGPLTDEEYVIVKRHPQIGAEIVGQMKALQDLVPLVAAHHERWDGKGYPAGLAGEDIPLGARVLAVADTLDAMCSDRPYRPPMTLEQVVAEMQRCSGKHFDPRVVAAFLEVAAEKGSRFFENSAAVVDRTVLVTSITDATAATRHVKKSMLQ